MKHVLCALVIWSCPLFVGSLFADAQDQTSPASQPAVIGQWVNISDPVVAMAGKVPRPGVTAVAVDPTTGDLYLGYGQAGLWKSGDQGRTWVSADDGKYTAMGTSSYSCDFDPAGKRLAFWGMYGDNIMTLDGGKTWVVIGAHRDWGTVDWSDPLAQTMWASPHGGGSDFSFDQGKTWNKKPEDRITALGIFDAHTFAGLLVDAVFLSTENGDNFVKKTRRIAPTSETCMRVYKGVGYWVSPQGLILSKDKGASWQVQGKPLRNPIAGPFFGESEKHIVVVTSESFMETTDGGETWNAAAPALGDPRWDDDHGETRACRYFAWDAQHDVFYGGKLFSTAMKYVHPPNQAAPIALPEPVAAVEETKIVWNGEKVFPKSFGHFDVPEGNSFHPQTDEVHQGKVALEMAIGNAPEEAGEAIARGGWNWHGWWPEDSGDDLTSFTHFVFWMKVQPGKKIDHLSAGLISSKPRSRSPVVDVTRYCPTALDGDWHEIAIPTADLVIGGGQFNPKLAWELRIESQTAASEVPYSIYFDDLSFQKRASPTTEPGTK